MDERKKDIIRNRSQDDKELIVLILEKNDGNAYKILEKRYSKILANLIRKMIRMKMM
jgi:hypothetical protein